jgi:phenylalanyl-tRNA synthetase beta chain
LRPVEDSKALTNDRLVKDFLVLRHSFNELHSYLWCDGKRHKEYGFDIENNVTILNNITPENNVLRNSILPSLIFAANANKTYADNIKVFEIGRVVKGLIGKAQLCNERRTLGFVLFSKTKTEKELYFEAVEIVKGLFEEAKHTQPSFHKQATVAHNWQHPKNTAAIEFNGVKLGTIGILNPKNADLLDKNGAAYATVEIDMVLFDEATQIPLAFSEISKFPGIERDLTLLITKDNSYAKAKEILVAEELENLKEVKVTDIFPLEEGDAVTIRLSFVSNTATLSNDSVQPGIDKYIADLKASGIELH